MRKKKRVIFTILVALGLFITTSPHIENNNLPTKSLIEVLMDEPIDGNH
ncbi:hypothetical protein MKX53_13165 [Psychrobacillus sp. FSL K6-4615]